MPSIWFAIVRTYADGGKSGLVLSGRDALQRLLDDVKSRRADFTAILVYDVSRWGRFQDVDESAYYEYQCRRNGVDVIYCAEPFKNDHSIASSIIKNLKRAMAGEYSRELSAKTFYGQCRMVRLGFHVTSAAGFGLRRVLTDGRGNRKCELGRGEWKNIRSDRIVLAPGPQHEVETVQEMFRLYVEEKVGLKEIARRLNAQGTTNAFGRRWQGQGVRLILGNERYIGNYVFNRKSCKLKGRVTHNAPDEWIRTVGAFEATVSVEMFQRAQQALKQGREYSREELLDALKGLLSAKGTLSAEILASTPGAPSAGVFRRSFGSLMNAYREVGYVSNVWADRSANLNMAKTIYAEIAEGARSTRRTYDQFDIGTRARLKVERREP